MQLGDTYIITNAVQGWVEYSIKRFIPEVAKILDKITVISARTHFEENFPHNVEQWKMHAFLYSRYNAEKSLFTNIIAASDAEKDIAAAQNLATYCFCNNLEYSHFKNSLVKTVKFRDCPEPAELGIQINLMLERLPEIHSSPKNLCIRMVRYLNS